MNLGQSGSFAALVRSFLVGIGISIAAFLICGWLGLRLNFSPSLPVGIYIVSDAGRLVEFCPSEPFASMAITRGYRARGVCPDGGAPLLKPLVASPCDVVDVSAGGIDVNLVRVPNTAPLAADTKGRPLTHWPFGRYVVAPETVWVGSSYDPRSFDSRYFGPLSTAAVRHRLKALLTL
jgi:conjugative transfer signal peptidase TraF